MLRPIIGIILILNFSFALDLDKKLENILKLPPSQQYKALNRLKMEILKLKEKEREKFIKKLLLHYHINDMPSESIVKGNK